MLHRKQLSSPLTSGSLRPTKPQLRSSAHNSGTVIHRWRSLKLKTFLGLSPPSPERIQDMPSSRSCLCLLCPHLSLLLSLLLLAGLTGCGPDSSDNASGVEARASESKPPLSEQGSASGINPWTPVTSVANPRSLPSANGTGVPAGKAKELASSNDAVETWAQSAPSGAVDPLPQVLNATDERQGGAEALSEDQEYQDLLEEQEQQGLVVEQENQDLDQEGET